MANNYSPIRAKHNEVVRVTQSTGKYGSNTEIAIECGACGFGFNRTYHMAQLAQGYPHEVCPNCQTWNFIPYTISGRSGK